MLRCFAYTNSIIFNKFLKVFIDLTTLWGRLNYYHYFMDEKMETK